MPETFYATLEERGAADEAALEEARSMIGVPLRVAQWNTAATIDNIRHYALAIGDLNPLWLDAEYARTSVHGTIVAPPTFFFSIYQGIAPGLGGLAALNQEATWRFFDWARRDDPIVADAYIRDATLAEGRAGRKRIDQHGRINYWRDDGDGNTVKLAEVDTTVARVPTRGTGGLDYAPRESHRYTADELAEIERQVLAVRPRGNLRRSWESVKSGDVVDSVVKGPYTRMSMVCYYASAPGSPGYRAFDAWWRNHHLATTNPDGLPNTFDPSYFRGTGTSSMGHHDAHVGQAIGMPGVYDNGNQRIGVMATVPTNWMGDEGFLCEYTHRLRRPVILGDTLTISGQVTGTGETGPDLADGLDTRNFGQVTMCLTATNQLGEVVSSGEAKVLLPRDHQAMSANTKQDGRP
jgi:acyl dehydratase